MPVDDRVNDTNALRPKLDAQRTLRQ